MTFHDFLIGCASDCIEGHPKPVGGEQVAAAGEAGFGDQRAECQHVWLIALYHVSPTDAFVRVRCENCGAVRHG